MLTKLYVKMRYAFVREEGATATEYGVLVAFIAILLIAGASYFKDALNAFFTDIGDYIGTWSPVG
jgi:pilus assembly protein Flp/PilA